MHWTPEGRRPQPEGPLQVLRRGHPSPRAGGELSWLSVVSVGGLGCAGLVWHCFLRWDICLCCAFMLDALYCFVEVTEGGRGVGGGGGDLTGECNRDEFTRGVCH